MIALRMNRTRLGLASVVLVLVLAALGAGCGDDDESSDSGPAAARTETGPQGVTGGDGAGSGRDGGGESPAQDPGGGTPSADGGTGGARAPRTGDARRRSSLARYLASKYIQTPWYPRLRRLKVRGTHVTVYLNFDPNSDDESPPQLACTAVLSYGRDVRSVTVYGSPTSQGRTAILKRC